MAKFYAKAPDGSDALLSIVLTGFTQSLQQNGWCKLPNGLLFQWRKMNYVDLDGYPYSIAFPISFTTYMCSIAGIDCFGEDKNGILFRIGTNTTLSTLEIYGIRMQLFSKNSYDYKNDHAFACEVYGRFIFLGY